MKSKIALVIAAAALILAGVAGASKVSRPSVGVAQSKLGRILVDGRGRSLYLFEKDRNGKSSCNGACVAYWPPLIAAGKPLAKPGVKASLLGRTKRKGGRRSPPRGTSRRGASSRWPGAPRERAARSGESTCPGRWGASSKPASGSDRSACRT